MSRRDPVPNGCAWIGIIISGIRISCCRENVKKNLSFSYLEGTIKQDLSWAKDILS